MTKEFSQIKISEAIELQEALREKICLKNSFQEIHTIAACDLALDHNPRFSPKGYLGKAIAVCIVFSFPGLEILDKFHHMADINFPYIPGLLSFRESPIYLELIDKYKINPDLFIFDGQGIAHPRGMGIASHMGLILNKPSIGCAKSLLYGDYQDLDLKQGSYAELKSRDGKFLGYALRTKNKTNPVFISSGHFIDHQTSLEIMLHCCDAYRIPKPTRLADKYAAEAKKLYML